MQSKKQNLPLPAVVKHARPLNTDKAPGTWTETEVSRPKNSSTTTGTSTGNSPLNHLDKERRDE